MGFCAMSPDGVLPEMMECEDHPWFIGVQFHPELKSRPFEPHPLFASFVGAAVEQSRLGERGRAWAVWPAKAATPGIGVGKELPPPPSEPYGRVARVPPFRWWFPHRECLAAHPACC